MVGATSFLQTTAVPVIVAVGNGCIVTVALPVSPREQAAELASFTLNRLYTNAPEALVETGNVTLFPLIVVIVWLAPPFIL